MSSLFCFEFQRCREQDDNAWQYFLSKTFNKISVEKLIFCKSGTSLYLEQGKLPAKAVQNHVVTAPPKCFFAISELQGDLCQHQKWPVIQKSLISTFVLCVFVFFLSWMLYNEFSLLYLEDIQQMPAKCQRKQG